MSAAPFIHQGDDMLTPEKIARIHALYLRGSPHESDRLFPDTVKDGVKEVDLTQEEIDEIMLMAMGIKQVHLGNLFEKW